MKTNNLIKALQEYEPNDHNKPGDIYFWDTERECYMELTLQHEDDPGIEHMHNMGCGCVTGFILNFKRKE